MCCLCWLWDNPAFTGALGHVARCITHQDGTILHTPRPRVLRDRMRLHPDRVEVRKKKKIQEKN